MIFFRTSRVRWQCVFRLNLWFWVFVSFGRRCCCCCRCRCFSCFPYIFFGLLLLILRRAPLVEVLKVFEPVQEKERERDSYSVKQAMINSDEKNVKMSPLVAIATYYYGFKRKLLIKPKFAIQIRFEIYLWMRIMCEILYL